MKETRFKIYLTALLLISIAVDMVAQSNSVTSGGEATGSGGSVSYSIGQIDYITAQGSGGIMTEGLQQPYEIYTIVGVGEVEISLEMAVFPNPARDMVNLQIEQFNNDNMSFKLYSLEGKLVMDQKIIAKQTQLDLSGLALSTYMLQVFTDGREIKTFKIIKNI